MVDPHPSRRRHALGPVGRARRIVVSLGPDDWAALAALARGTGRSLSSTIRTLIRSGEQAEQPKKPSE